MTSLAREKASASSCFIRRPMTWHDPWVHGPWTMVRAEARKTERGISYLRSRGTRFRSPRESPTVGDLDSPACHLQSPSRPPLATRRGKKCRSMAGASTVRYRPVSAHHSHMSRNS